MTGSCEIALKYTFAVFGVLLPLLARAELDAETVYKLLSFRLDGIISEVTLVKGKMDKIEMRIDYITEKIQGIGTASKFTPEEIDAVQHKEVEDVFAEENKRALALTVQKTLASEKRFLRDTVDHLKELFDKFKSDVRREIGTFRLTADTNVEKIADGFNDFKSDIQREMSMVKFGVNRDLESMNVSLAEKAEKIYGFLFSNSAVVSEKISVLSSELNSTVYTFQKNFSFDIEQLETRITAVEKKPGAYYGTSFIAGFMENLYVWDAIPTLLFACSERTAVVTVSVPALNITNQKHTLIDGKLSLTFPPTITSATSGMISNNGVYVTADRPITLSSGSFRIFGSSEGSWVPPEVSLGTDYIISGHHSTIYGTDEFLIVATIDNTTVKTVISSKKETITLNKMETYVRVAANLTGTRISASAPVYVLSGHTCANIPSNDVNNCDFIEESMPSMQSLGTVHVVSFMRPRPDFTISIVAVYNGTSVIIYDAFGKTIEYLSPNVMSSPVFRSYTSFRTISVISSKPVLVTQYGHGSSRTLGDPSMMVIPDVRHFGHQYDFVVPDNLSRITVVMSSAYSVSLLLLNGQEFTPSQTLSVKIPGYGVYNIMYGNVSAGYNRLTHAEGLGVSFGAWVYGFTYNSEYAWSLGHT